MQRASVSYLNIAILFILYRVPNVWIAKVIIHIFKSTMHMEFWTSSMKPWRRTFHIQTKKNECNEALYLESLTATFRTSATWTRRAPWTPLTSKFNEELVYEYSQGWLSHGRHGLRIEVQVPLQSYIQVRVWKQNREEDIALDTTRHDEWANGHKGDEKNKVQRKRINNDEKAADVARGTAIKKWYDKGKTTTTSFFVWKSI